MPKRKCDDLDHEVKRPNCAGDSVLTQRASFSTDLDSTNVFKTFESCGDLDGAKTALAKQCNVGLNCEAVDSRDIGVETVNNSDNFTQSDKTYDEENRGQVEKSEETRTSVLDSKNQVETQGLQERDSCESIVESLLDKEIEDDSVFESSENITEDQTTGPPIPQDKRDESSAQTQEQVKDDDLEPPRKRKRRVKYNGVKVYFFPRKQGFICVPSQGGSTLGMSENHAQEETYTLSEFASIQRQIHGAILLDQHRQGKIQISTTKVEQLQHLQEAEQQRRQRIHERLKRRAHRRTVSESGTSSSTLSIPNLSDTEGATTTSVIDAVNATESPQATDSDTATGVNDIVSSASDPARSSSCSASTASVGDENSSSQSSSGVQASSVDSDPCSVEESGEIEVQATVTQEGTHEETNEEASSNTDEEEGQGLAIDEYYFLQPVTTRQRRVMLRQAGIKKIDAQEKDLCKDIRTSREVCGCDCKGVCNPATCICSQAGIKCQVDRLSFPCGCSKDGCGNPSGRIEFNPIRVRTHFIHTLMRLENERKLEQRKRALAAGRRRQQQQQRLASQQRAAVSHVRFDDNGQPSPVASPALQDASERSEDDASSTDLSQYNSNELGSCRDCQNTEMNQLLMRHQQQQQYRTQQQLAAQQAQYAQSQAQIYGVADGHAVEEYIAENTTDMFASDMFVPEESSYSESSEDCSSEGTNPELESQTECTAPGEVHTDLVSSSTSTSTNAGDLSECTGINVQSHLVASVTSDIHTTTAPTSCFKLEPISEILNPIRFPGFSGTGLESWSPGGVLPSNVASNGQQAASNVAYSTTATELLSGTPPADSFTVVPKTPPPPACNEEAGKQEQQAPNATSQSGGLSSDSQEPFGTVYYQELVTCHTAGSTTAHTLVTNSEQCHAQTANASSFPAAHTNLSSAAEAQIAQSSDHTSSSVGTQLVSSENVVSYDAGSFSADAESSGAASASQVLGDSQIDDELLASKSVTSSTGTATDDSEDSGLGSLSDDQNATCCATVVSTATGSGEECNAMSTNVNTTPAVDSFGDLIKDSLVEAVLI